MLSLEQEQAQNKIAAWLSSSDWCFVLGGYAGTGKTFLLSHLVNTLDRKVICCAPTGKAASVLGAKLPDKEVVTVHKVLYIPYEKNRMEIAELRNKLKKNPNDFNLINKLNQLMKNTVGFERKGEDKLPKNALIIVDEASMVNTEMADDLRTTGCKILFVGDPGQLPPVSRKSFFKNTKFDHVLKVVHRQALDSPIIRLSMDIRKGRYDTKQYQYHNCKFVRPKIVDGKTVLDSETFTEADQIITGTNTTRHKLNRWVRSKLDFHGTRPSEGEKLICLKNVADMEGYGQFINGVQAIALSDSEDETMAFKGEKVHHFRIDMLYDDRTELHVPVYDYHCRAHYEKRLQELPYTERYGMMEFDFGYAITAHKAQGSEWNSVIVADDKMRSNYAEERKRWLYTAVTRAKDKLLIVDL